jgi:glutathione-regulated potassium-efflux system ancillary protein KefC
MVALLIFTAFAFGFLVTRLGLPPLIGYLIAGFTLNYFGVEGSEELEQVADIGVLLLLFSIGLKLKVKSLLRVEIWGSASLHMAVVTVLFSLLFYILGLVGLSSFGGFTLSQAALIAFGLSFSSTVFAVKTFEERGDGKALHSNIAIGILIIQDIAAVLFLTFTSGKFPSIWALALIAGLFIFRTVLNWILSRSGHRELLLLFGIFVAVGLGAGSFELVNLKPDLGALIFGILLAENEKAGEVSDAILSLKDLFLVGFFLNIGLLGFPTFTSLIIALFFIVLMVLKTALFYRVFTHFKLRARTAHLSSLALTNYSEFGLLVCAVGMKQGIIGKEWLVTMALAVAISFLIASPLNSKALQLYSRFCGYLKRFESEDRLPFDQPIDTGDANVLVFGMGRIGTRIFDTMNGRNGLTVVGLDLDPDRLTYHKEHGRAVVRGDATDADLWEKICTHKVKIAMLTMASHAANMFAIGQLKKSGFDGKISAIAQFDDDLKELKDAGAHIVYDIYDQAGRGYADDILDKLEFTEK